MMFKISCTHTRLFSKSRNVVNGSPKSFITQNHNKRCEFKVHHLSRIQPFGIWKRLPYLSHHTSYSTNNEQLKQHERKENNGKDRFSLPLLGAALPVVCAFSLFFKKDRTDAECEGEPLSPEINFPTYKKKGVKNAINHCRDLVQRVKDEVGSPGLIIAVHVDGKEVWSEGLGYADVENRVPCGSNTVMRIASISKSITMAIAGRLIEHGKIDLDKDVKNYVKEWPDKEFGGSKVTITTRQLVSHVSGIRHYNKDCQVKTDEQKSKQKSEEEKKKEFQQKEYYMKRNFPDIASSLNLFKDDPLCFKPGNGFLYTSHGWTLISAVIEGASGKKFTHLARQTFKDLGLKNTFLDEPTQLIYKRACNYVKNKGGRLENAPYVDNSYKWAGGGFLSTAPDLCKFGDAMLYSSQSSHKTPKGYLKPETMRAMWTPAKKNAPCPWDKDGYYTMGWCSTPDSQHYAQGRQVRQYMSHTGGAIGASSVLIVMPRKAGTAGDVSTGEPKGVTVAIAVNLQGVGLNRTAVEIARIFDEAVEVCDE